jgi:creatinine amidohydrolase
MRFDELNWFDVEDYLKHEDRIIFVLGACEQHGYLSLLSDVLIPQALADAACQKTGVLVAPAINFGSSPYFQAYPGTLSLRSSTLMDIVEDLIRSAYQQGFKRFLFLNGHGGNDAVRSRLYETANLFPSIQIAWYAWWLSHSVEEVAKQNQLKPAHANWLEAFRFTRVSELPEGEKPPPRVPGLMNAEQARRVYGDGSFGGPYQASESVMQNIFQAALDDILQLLKFE